MGRGVLVCASVLPRLLRIPPCCAHSCCPSEPMAVLQPVLRNSGHLCTVLAGTVSSSTNVYPGSQTVCRAAQTLLEAVTCCSWPSSQRCQSCLKAHGQLQSMSLGCSEGTHCSPSLISLGKGKFPVECGLTQ